MGAGIGFCIGLTGIGGGVLVLPALTVVLGISASVAVGTASLYSFLTKCYASLEHFRIKTIDVKTSLFILLGALPGNIIVARAINRAVEKLRLDGNATEHFQDNLRLFIASIVMFAALVLTANLLRRKRKTEEGEGSSLCARLDSRPKLKWSIAAITGLVIGSLIGATAVGGGVLMIPVLIIVFGLPSSTVVGTSIFATVVLNLVTSAIYSCNGQVDWPTALLMAAGSLLGVRLGSKLCIKLPERGLRALVIAAVFIAATLMFLKG